MYFWKYRLRKIFLDKCLKSRVSQDPYTDKKANGSKHCCNLNGRTSSIFINHCEETFSTATTFIVINKYCKSSAIQIATVFLPICLVFSLRVFSNTAFLTIFLGATISKNKSAMRVIFFWLMFKI